MGLPNNKTIRKIMPQLRNRPKKVHNAKPPKLRVQRSISFIKSMPREVSCYTAKPPYADAPPKGG